MDKLFIMATKIKEWVKKIKMPWKTRKIHPLNSSIKSPKGMRVSNNTILKTAISESSKPPPLRSQKPPQFSGKLPTSRQVGMMASMQSLPTNNSTNHKSTFNRSNPRRRAMKKQPLQVHPINIGSNLQNSSNTDNIRKPLKTLNEKGFTDPNRVFIPQPLIKSTPTKLRRPLRQLNETNNRPSFYRTLNEKRQKFKQAQHNVNQTFKQQSEKYIDNIVAEQTKLKQLETRLQAATNKNSHEYKDLKTQIEIQKNMVDLAEKHMGFLLANYEIVQSKLRENSNLNDPKDLHEILLKSLNENSQKPNINMSRLIAATTKNNNNNNNAPKPKSNNYEDIEIKEKIDTPDVTPKTTPGVTSEATPKTTPVARPGSIIYSNVNPQSTEPTQPKSAYAQVIRKKIPIRKLSNYKQVVLKNNSNKSTPSKSPPPSPYEIPVLQMEPTQEQKSFNNR